MIVAAWVLAISAYLVIGVWAAEALEIKSDRGRWFIMLAWPIPLLGLSLAMPFMLISLLFMEIRRTRGRT